MTDIRRALMRKFGPLPAWAWGLIGGAVLYLYRHNAALKAGGTVPPSTNATDPGVTDSSGGGGGGDPVTVDPGQGVYDPNTGQLLGNAASQQPSEQPIPQTPITLEPGESVYDPNTGELQGPPTVASAPADIGAGKASTPPAKKARTILKRSAAHGGRLSVYHVYPHKSPVFVRLASKAAQRVTKRTQKNRQQHAKTPTAKSPTHGSSKPRGIASVLRGPKASRATSKATARPPARSRVPTAAVNNSRTRSRPTRAASPALRQRPAAPRVVDHATQQTSRHPAAPPPAHHAPAPKRRRK